MRALDAFSLQVHSHKARRPAPLDPGIELIVGDIPDPRAVHKALTGEDAAHHFAALVARGLTV